MSRRIYSEINLHITWHTKDNLRFIDDRIKPHLHKYLQNRIIETNGVYFHAVGGIDDHIHIAVSVKPSVGLDNWIGQLKGAKLSRVWKGSPMAIRLWRREFWV